MVTVRKAKHKNHEEATCEKRVSRIATNKNHEEANHEKFCMISLCLILDLSLDVEKHNIHDVEKPTVGDEEN